MTGRGGGRELQNGIIACPKPFAPPISEDRVKYVFTPFSNLKSGDCEYQNCDFHQYNGTHCHDNMLSNVISY